MFAPVSHSWEQLSWGMDPGLSTGQFCSSHRAYHLLQVPLASPTRSQAQAGMGTSWEDAPRSWASQLFYLSWSFRLLPLPPQSPRACSLPAVPSPPGFVPPATFTFLSYTLGSLASQPGPHSPRQEGQGSKNSEGLALLLPLPALSWDPSKVPHSPPASPGPHSPPHRDLWAQPRLGQWGTG